MVAKSKTKAAEAASGAKVDSKDFTWVSNDLPIRDAFITADKQLRLYFNVAARQRIKARDIVIGYDYANKRIIVGGAEVIRPANVRPHRVDKRGYTSARPFLRSTGFAPEDLPLTFEYIGRDFTVDGAHAFELIETEGLIEPEGPRKRKKAGGDGRL